MSNKSKRPKPRGFSDSVVSPKYSAEEIQTRQTEARARKLLRTRELWGLEIREQSFALLMEKNDYTLDILETVELIHIKLISLSGFPHYSSLAI